MKILALDLGTHDIKAVMLDVAFGRVELEDYFVERVREPSPAKTATAGETKNGKRQAAPGLSKGQEEAIRRIFASRALRYERLAVNIPRSRVTARLLNLPTRDRKAIQNSLRFELEDDIPFPLEEAAVDFAVLKTEGASSTVFAAVALKSDVLSLLDELQALGLDPDWVTIDAWSASHLLRRAIPPAFAGKPVCLVNIGATLTSINVFVGSDPLVTHVTSCGGEQITRAIASGYRLTPEEAEQAKIDGAFLITETHLRNDPGLTEEQKQFSAALEEALAPLVRELKQTLISYKSNYHHPLRAVFVTGGTSLIPNLPLYLEEHLQIPVFPYSYISHLVGQTLQLSESSEARISNSVGLALAAVKPDRNAMINFRRDEFAKRGGVGAMSLAAYRKGFALAAAALAFVYANLFVQYLVLSARTGKQQAHLERAIKSVLGAVSPSVLSTYVNSPSALKAAVEKELAKYKESQPISVKPPSSGLDLLKQVSGAMPRDMTLDVSLFQLKDGKFRMTGTVDRSTDVERVMNALQETGTLGEVAKGKVEDDPRKKPVKFELTAKLVEAADAGKAR